MEKQDGLWERFHENGQLAYRANYKNGKLHGLWESFHENGKVKHRQNFFF